jgi:DNA-binding NarL/FixJ family response regulator
MEIKVAIFEDNKTLCTSLEQLVNASTGMLCTGAFCNANRLLRDMELAEPDVVMMDINMPGVSGIEAVQLIKEKYPHVNVLMQTVFEDNDKVFAAICAGASGYILKKTSPQKMIEAIIDTYQGGSPMTPSVAGKVLAMLRMQTVGQKPAFIQLSEREKDILTLLVKAKSYKAIAAACFISIDTVKTHVRHIYEKLQVHSKSEAVVKAIHQKLV